VSAEEKRRAKVVESAAKVMWGLPRGSSGTCGH
jgi:hypothetical protein